MAYFSQERLQIFGQRFGQRRSQKLPLNFHVIFAMQGKVQKVIFRNEFIEYIGGQNDGGGHRDAHARKAPADATLAQEVAHESKASSFAPERTGANPQKT